MDSWPTDDRKSDTLRRAKDKGKEKEGNNNYTHFQQGLLSAVTLFGNNGRVEWTSLVNKHPKGWITFISLLFSIDLLA
jgi:hypothetical protein